MSIDDPRGYLMEDFSQEQVNSARSTKKIRISEQVARFSNFTETCQQTFDMQYQSAMDKLHHCFNQNNVEPLFEFNPRIEIDANTDYGEVVSIYMHVQCELMRHETDDEVRFRLATEAMRDRENESRKKGVLLSLRSRIEAANKRIAEEQEKIAKITQQLENLENE